MKGFLEIKARRANSGFMGKEYKPMIISTNAISSVTPTSSNRCQILLTEVSDADEHGNPHLKVFEVDLSVEAVGELLRAALAEK